MEISYGLFLSYSRLVEGDVRNPAMSYTIGRQPRTELDATGSLGVCHVPHRVRSETQRTPLAPQNKVSVKKNQICFSRSIISSLSQKEG